MAALAMISIEALAATISIDPGEGEALQGSGLTGDVPPVAWYAALGPSPRITG
jgi:hypothetical protein